ncbi:hypothetical protein M422DRAFT_33892 [Sphaerobolus stellatus SS14]|uniref:Uncharacterized protein n=1 Tax=Sphaerobolus stellatus (strain SS14) TaxID=990650 RepID=A0A0C9U2W9_SPHS4|nr:hypothetical protein M422DRAFT_33892 [Sphaerobolus stellatus SS14]
MCISVYTVQPTRIHQYTITHYPLSSPQFQISNGVAKSQGVQYGQKEPRKRNSCQYLNNFSIINLFYVQ